MKGICDIYTSPTTTFVSIRIWQFSALNGCTMAALTATPMSSTFEPTPTPNSFLAIFPGRPADKYRGAVVEVRCMEVVHLH